MPARKTPLRLLQTGARQFGYQHNPVGVHSDEQRALVSYRDGTTRWVTFPADIRLTDFVYWVDALEHGATTIKTFELDR